MSINFLYLSTPRIFLYLIVTGFSGWFVLILIKAIKMLILSKAIKMLILIKAIKKLFLNKANYLCGINFFSFFPVLIVLFFYMHPPADFIVPGFKGEASEQLNNIKKEVYAILPYKVEFNKNEEVDLSSDQVKKLLDFRLALVNKSYDQLTQICNLFQVALGLFVGGFGFVAIRLNYVNLLLSCKIQLKNSVCLGCLGIALSCALISATATYHLIVTTLDYLNRGIYIHIDWLRMWLSHQFYFWVFSLIFLCVAFLIGEVSNGKKGK